MCIFRCVVSIMYNSVLFFLSDYADTPILCSNKVTIIVVVAGTAFVVSWHNALIKGQKTGCSRAFDLCIIVFRHSLIKFT